MTINSIQTTTFRNNIADIIDEVQKRRSIMLLTKRGEPVSAIVNIDLIEDLLALSSSKYKKSIKEARAQYKRGEVVDHAMVFGKI